MIFHLHRFDISQAFRRFSIDHPDMSVNRCAYYVLKTYYSTTVIRAWKEMFEVFGLSYEGMLNLQALSRGVYYGL